MLAKITEKEKSVSLLHLSLIIGIFLIQVTISLLQGGKGIDSLIGIKKCTFLYWILTVVYVLFCLLFIFIAIRIAINENQLKMNSGYKFEQYDVK